MAAAGDWRSQFQPDARHRMVNMIVEVLKRHIHFSGEEGLNMIERIAVDFEEKVYVAAATQTDYLRIISYKMLVMEQKTRNSNGSSSSLPSSSNQNPSVRDIDVRAGEGTSSRQQQQQQQPQSVQSYQLEPDVFAIIVNELREMRRGNIRMREIISDLRCRVAPPGDLMLRGSNEVRDVNERGVGVGGGGGGGGGSSSRSLLSSNSDEVAPNVSAVIVSEVRELKRENFEMREAITDLHGRVATLVDLVSRGSNEPRDSVRDIDERRDEGGTSIITPPSVEFDEIGTDVYSAILSEQRELRRDYAETIEVILELHRKFASFENFMRGHTP